MPARDLHHTCVRNALIKDGWTITHDPLRLAWGGKDVYVDLGAQRLLAADRGSDKIAVEIKGFARESDMEQLEQAVGQYVLYRAIMSRRDPGRELYLAVPELVARGVFETPVGELMRQDQGIRLIAFDPVEEVILRWIP